MKKFLVMAVAALVAVSAFAIIPPGDREWPSWSVAWQIGMAASPDDPDTALMDDYGIIWDLFWSASADKSDSIVLGTRVFDSGSETYSDDDQNPTIYTMVVEFDNWLGGAATTYFPVDKSGTTASSGYVWQRIIAVSESPNGTDYIWESGVSAISPIDSAIGFPTGLDGEANMIGVDPGYTWSVYSSPAAIPEPATMSLLGLGALAMVIRRKLRK